MSLDTPRYCEMCGENMHGHGHKQGCANETDDAPPPEAQICSWCKCEALFRHTGPFSEWRSECCDARPVPVDREPPENDDAWSGGFADNH
jgi:hypothetical protein